MKHPFDRLVADGYHLFPTKRDKKPDGRWRRGEVDWVETQPDTEQVERWLRRHPPGWILLCGGPMRLVCLDVEASGLVDTTRKGEVIRAELDRLPQTCKRPTPSGGVHGWVQITDGAAPGGSGGRLVVKIVGPQEAILMAELRGHGQYACLLGHGRGELPEDWAPHPMTRAEWEALADRLRAVSDTQPSDRMRRKRDSVPREPAERDWRADPPRDTGDVLARALVEGRLSWLDVLDEGWSELGSTPDGWSLWLRPEYGSPPSSESSANGCELRGVPSLTMHSTAVPWAEGEVSYSPAEVLARSGRLGTTDFATAMRQVEMAAIAGGHHALPDWPTEVLAEVAELREYRLDTEARGRPPMHVGLDADWEDEILGELGTGATAALFRRGDDMVHVPRIGEKGYLPPPEEDGKDGPAQVRVVNGKRLRFLLGRAYWLFKVVVTKHGSEKVHVRAPGAVCDDIAGNAHSVPGLRALGGVVHAPFLRADGSLLAEPGYDEPTGVLYLPTVEVPEVPGIPTEAEVAAARELVAELLVDFPFVTTHDRANMLGLLMLPLLREIIGPPWPLAIFNAHQMGSGKTLLGKLLLVLHDGVLRTKLPNDDDEIRKSLTALLHTTTGTVVVFDNQVGVIASGELANLLTSAKRSDRKLGETQELALTNDRLFAVTGNNVQLGGDMPRRGLWVSIDPGVPRPWERTGFAIANLEQYVREHRGELLAAMLTLCRHWVAVGMPVGAESRSDDYGRLVSVMRGLLPAVGLEGTFMHPETNLAELGVDDDEWHTFLAAVHEWSAKAASTREPASDWFTAKELVDEITIEPIFRRTRVVEALPSEMTNRALTAASLGRFLSNREGRFMGEYVIRKSDARAGIKSFRVEKSSQK